MAGVTSVPAGSERPSTSRSVTRRRPASGTTGRSRSDSDTTARRYGSPPPRAGGRALRAGAGQRLRVVGEQVDRPGEAGGGGLVAGDQQGHQLVADLAVLQRAAV